MPRLTRVWVWSESRRPHKPWHDLPETDSFARTARRVSEAFRQSLERENLRVRDGELELTLDDHLDDREIVLSVVERGTHDGPESASVTVSRDFHRLDPYTRAFFVADALHASARRLGEVHGWDLEALDRAMDRVRVDDYRFDFAGEWVASPDGTERARLVVRLLDDGFGRVHVEFAASDGVVPTIVTDELVAGTTRGDFRRLSRSLAWDETSVSARGAGVAFTADGTTGALAVRRAVRVPLPNSATVDSSMPLPRVRVEPVPPIAFTLGGGPMNRVPKRYAVELDRLLAFFAYDAEWIGWWLELGFADIELAYDFDVKNVGTRIRTRGDSIACTIKRPVRLIARGEAGEAMARADVEALVAAVLERTGAVAHPLVPEDSDAP